MLRPERENPIIKTILLRIQTFYLSIQEVLPLIDIQLCKEGLLQSMKLMKLEKHHIFEAQAIIIWITQDLEILGLIDSLHMSKMGQQGEDQYP